MKREGYLPVNGGKGQVAELSLNVHFCFHTIFMTSYILILCSIPLLETACI